MHRRCDADLLADGGIERGNPLGGQEGGRRRRLAQYFFIRSETSLRSSGGIDFLPLRFGSGTGSPPPRRYSSRVAMACSTRSFSIFSKRMVSCKSIGEN